MAAASGRGSRNGAEAERSGRCGIFRGAPECAAPPGVKPRCTQAGEHGAGGRARLQRDLPDQAGRGGHRSGPGLICGREGPAGTGRLVGSGWRQLDHGSPHGRPGSLGRPALPPGYRRIPPPSELSRCRWGPPRKVLRGDANIIYYTGFVEGAPAHGVVGECHCHQGRRL